MERPLVVIDDSEADVLTEHFLHCGTVVAGEEWDTLDAWPNSAVRAAARRMLIRYRKTGQLPDEGERRTLATCCGG